MSDSVVFKGRFLRDSKHRRNSENLITEFGDILRMIELFSAISQVNEGMYGLRMKSNLQINQIRKSQSSNKLNPRIKRRFSRRVLETASVMDETWSFS
jgi:hypothetical protein